MNETTKSLYALSVLLQLKDGEVMRVPRLIQTKAFFSGKPVLFQAMTLAHGRIAVRLLLSRGLIERTNGIAPFAYRITDAGFEVLRVKGLIESLDTKALLTELRGSHGKT